MHHSQCVLRCFLPKNVRYSNLVLNRSEYKSFGSLSRPAE
jgi:hypothetical protein